VSARTGIRIRDSQTGFRLIGRRVLSALVIQADGYEAETEILIKAARMGFSDSWCADSDDLQRCAKPYDALDDDKAISASVTKGV